MKWTFDDSIAVWRPEVMFAPLPFPTIAGCRPLFAIAPPFYLVRKKKICGFLARCTGLLLSEGIIRMLFRFSWVFLRAEMIFEVGERLRY